MENLNESMPIQEQTQSTVEMSADVHELIEVDFKNKKVLSRTTYNRSEWAAAEEAGAGLKHMTLSFKAGAVIKKLRAPMRMK